MTYLCGPPLAESQLRGRLRLGCGQAGHSITSSPNDVAAAPSGTCLWPDRLRVKRCLQIRIAR